jgi:hypothetical protein
MFFGGLFPKKGGHSSEEDDAEEAPSGPEPREAPNSMGTPQKRSRPRKAHDAGTGSADTPASKSVRKQGKRPATVAPASGAANGRVTK